MPLQVLERRERTALTEAPRAYPDADRVAEVRALGWIEEIGGYGVETREQRGAGRASVPQPVKVEAQSLDNGLLRVIVSPAGDVRLEDRASGRVIESLLSLEQEHEVGDLYTPAQRETLAAPRVRRVRVVHRGPLRGELAIDLVYASPAGAEGGRCRLSLQLDAVLPALRVNVTGDNRAGDHRLRVRVATGLAGATTLADAAFHPVRRSPLTISSDEARTEHVVPTAPLHRYVSRFTAERGATLFSDGLAEYESLEDGAIAVTLLRAVAELSRSDLPERPGHAGWPASTPLAQSIGPFAANFGLALHGPDSPGVRDQIERLADDVLLPITGETLRSNLVDPLTAGGLELSGEGLAFSAAFPAQREGWIVLRCVNRRNVAGHGRWRIGRNISEAQLARLDEAPSGPLVVDGDTVDFPAGAGEIVTVLLR
jgi:hypothetical protein